MEFQTVWCKSICFELPRGGGRTHGRTHGGIISFELSPLARCMRISRLLALPPRLDFQAVIKSAASAASPAGGRKNREQMIEKLPLGAFYIGIPNGNVGF